MHKSRNILLVLICFISVVITLYAFEISLIQGQKHGFGVPAVAKERRLLYKEQTPRQVWHERRKVAPSAVPLVFVRGADALKDILPIGGVSERLTLLCAEGAEFTSYQSDEHGFNNPLGIWTADEIEILALGDSYTSGHCVPPEKNLLADLRKTYAKTINLGMGGNGPFRQLAGLIEYGKIVKPKITLWVFYDNDIENITRESENPKLSAYLNSNPIQGLFHRQKDIDAFLMSILKREASTQSPKNNQRRMDGTIDILLLRNLRQKIGLSVFVTIKPRKPARNNLKIFRTVMEKAKSIVSEWDGRLYFVHLPGWLRFCQPGLFTRNCPKDLKSIQQVHKDGVETIVRDLDIPFLDGSLVLEKLPNPEKAFWYAGSHYSLLGYETMSKAIVNFIVERSRLSTCKNSNTPSCRIPPVWR